MFFENKLFRKILLNLIFALFVFWIIINPDIKLSYKDGIIVIMFFALIHSLIDNRHMLKRLSRKYEAQSKLLSCIFRNCNNDNEQVNSYYSSESPKNVEDELLAGKPSVSYKIAKKFLNGDVKLYDAHITSLKDGENDVQDYFGVVKDTTTTDTLKEKIMIQNAQLSSILNNMPFVIYVKDVEGRFIAGNKRLETFLKRKNEELVGKHTYEIVTHLKEYADIIKEQDINIIKNKQTITSDFKIPFDQNESSWFSVIKTPVLSPDGDVFGIIAVAKNVNKEKEVELQRDTFVATLTHDLKTPTSAQITVMDILLSGSTGTLTEEQRNLIVQAKNSNVYMFNMISTILATYKSEGSDVGLNLGEFDFFEMINDTCKELACLADTREQRIVLKSELKDTLVFGDKLQLKRASTNLISNAIIHGFEKTEVLVELSEKRNKILFDVKNNSRYIDEGRRAEIFEKYKSAKYAKSNKASTGLGLYLSREIVKKHFGEIYVNSWKNDTCVFGFTIPKDLGSKVKQTK